VEAMFSYNVMFSVHGDVAFADRAERIAYNALPATWASPKGGDMWAHQYLQAINEINAIKADPHVWTHDGDDSEMYGLEPNFGCCTANFNQGWPKFANMLIYSTTDGGAAIGAYAPASAKLPTGDTVDIDTAYPYEDTVRIHVTAAKAMPLYVRIPGWASNATVNGAAAKNGTMHKVDCEAGGNTVTLELNPEIRLETWDNGAQSVHRGGLMYSLPLQANYIVTAHHFGGPTDSNDYEATTNATWNYALDVDTAHPSASLKFHQGAYTAGSAPFNHSKWPTYITAVAREVPSWGTALNSAAEVPISPVCSSTVACGQPTQVQLVPHGGTDLRIGELPLSGFK